MSPGETTPMEVNENEQISSTEEHSESDVLTTLATALATATDKLANKPYDYMKLCTEAIKILKYENLEKLVHVNIYKQKYLPGIHGELRQIITNLATENDTYKPLLDEYKLADENEGTIH